MLPLHQLNPTQIHKLLSRHLLSSHPSLAKIALICSAYISLALLPSHSPQSFSPQISPHISPSPSGAQPYLVSYPQPQLSAQTPTASSELRPLPPVDSGKRAKRTFEGRWA
ncbi:hypothetical protein K491DRAFT_687210 [Lophiostoma macrostomum CBS 122681]|uniref:Uncharacterized protein n=1 Tax=Lophiostoma macrostomum CBS 122681 TaxID=1314788 RepID=A0A6A6TT63_9PLEO|nr:hypothetical protein K491DRAFT_687210 [Lophiostoma macrostomum CBS 122681]